MFPQNSYIKVIDKAVKKAIKKRIHTQLQLSFFYFLLSLPDGWNKVIYPRPQFVVHWKGMYYYLPGTHELKSRKLVFSDFCTPFFLARREELRIWYGEDFTNWMEKNNHGRVCVDVYAKFIY